MKLIQIVHELRVAKGSNKKIKILEQHRDNEIWKKFLLYTYHPYNAYGVSSPKVSDFDAADITDEMFNAFDELNNRVHTGKAAIAMAFRLSSQFGEIPRLVLDRSVKAGITATTINKVYPGLIPTFESMKGKDVPIEEYPVSTSIKYDGVKLFVFVSEIDIVIRTSSGLPLKLRSLSDEFGTATFGVYEGELTHKEGKTVHRPIITGHLNSLLAGTKENIPDYKFRVYDFIPLEEWTSKNSTTTFAQRQAMLLSQFETGFADSAYVEYVEQHIHHGWPEVEEMFGELIKTGYEGTMSRYLDDVYTFKRVDRLVKKKSIKEAVLHCSEVIPHSNPAKGLIGSLVLSGHIEDKLLGKVFVNVNTGSGLSKFDINCEPERFIGETIEILYNSITQTESGYSLFLPRFKRICADNL